jgi:hypothetical protein
VAYPQPAPREFVAQPAHLPHVSDPEQVEVIGHVRPAGPPWRRSAAAGEKAQGRCEMQGTDKRLKVVHEASGRAAWLVYGTCYHGVPMPEYRAEPALEHVALNQTGFKVPGVAPDARGVVLGKQGALLLPSLERLVSFFRLLCQGPSLADLLPGLRIYEVRTRLTAREHLVLLPAQSSYLLDRCARAGALCGGLLCTGSGRHFVKYRDRASPLGYDVTSLSTEAGDFLLYTQTAVLSFRKIREIPFQRLVFDLSLLPVPGGAARDIDDLVAAREPGEALWILCQDGLAGRLIFYLWRNRVRFSAAHLGEGELVPAATGRAGAFRRGPDEALLVRAEGLQERMLRLLCGVPGMAVYRQVLPGALCEIGYRHPFRLESIETLFDKDVLVLFSGKRDACERLPAPQLFAGESLVDLDLDLRDPDEMSERLATRARALEVPLRLCPAIPGITPGSGHALGLPRAALVPWARVGLLKRIVYTLPPTLLAGYRVAPIEEGLLVLSDRPIDALPLGQLLAEAAPGVFLPAGLVLLPRISQEVLSAHLGGTADRCLLLLPEDVPGRQPGGPGRPVRALSVPHGAFSPLSRRALARVPIAVQERDPALPPPREQGEAKVLNEPIWGL